MTIGAIRITAIAFAVAASSPFAQAQTPATTVEAPSTTGAINTTDEGQAVTDQRIAIVKAALELRSDQTQYWPAVEQAIRSRAKGREARLKAASDRVSDVSDRKITEILRDRDPVAFLQRRSASFTQRGTELKNLADAWQPLYQTLSPDQKRRMAFLTVYVLREMRDKVEQRHMDDEDDGEG